MPLPQLEAIKRRAASKKLVRQTSVARQLFLKQRTKQRPLTQRQKTQLPLRLIVAKTLQANVQETPRNPTSPVRVVIN